MTAILSLFFRMVLRPLAKEPVRTALTLMAVSLGVAVVVAIDLAGVAAAGSFRSSLESLTGDTDLEISAIGGIDESLLGHLATLPYPLEFTPRIDGHAIHAGTGQTVPVIGIDMVANTEAAEALDDGAEARLDALNEADSVWVGEGFGLRSGDSLRLIVNDGTRSFTVRGLVRESQTTGTGNNLVLMDIAAAQHTLGRAGTLDRIDVRIPRESDSREWEEKLEAALPAGVDIAPRGARTDENRKMLAAFRWNLRVLSYIALVVGAFLIYNTISVSVVRRRAEIGVLRALGATRGGVIAGFLAEALAFGVTGTALGLLLGRAMAEGAVRLLASTVESLYVTSTPAPIEFSASSLLVAAAAGVGVALLAALAPAREAGGVPPIEAMARGRHEYRARLRAGRNLVTALALALAGIAAAQAPPVGATPIFGYLAALFLIAASAFAIPAIIAALSRAFSPVLQRVFGPEALLASRSLMASLWRTSVLVGALSTAVAMMASVGIMVGSFRQTVQVWMDQQLKADLYLRPAGPGGAGRHPVLDPGIADEIEALPQVAAVDRFRAYPISYGGLPATVGGGDTAVNRRFGRTQFLPGQDRDRILSLLPTGDYAIISEPFSNKHNLKAGDRITLPLGGQQPELEILGVYYDYSSERGYIILDRNVLQKYLPDPAPSNLAVFLTPEATLEDSEAAVARVTAHREVMVFTNSSLRREAIRIFDRTFAITYALEAVAILVAVMGVAGALLALVIDRRRELGLLRFLGASAGQIRRLILFEAGLLGLLANSVGFALGAALSLILIFVINKQSFGWTIQFHWPVALLAMGLTVVYAATVLAGLYPARTAVRLNPIEVVHEE